MGKSKDYILKRIKEQNHVVGLNYEDYKNCVEDEFKRFFCTKLEKEYDENTNVYSFSLNTKNDGNLELDIVMDENVTFDYFIIANAITDGTLYFIVSLQLEILQKLLRCETVLKNSIPKDFEHNLNKYRLTYTVGNFVVNIANNKNIPKDKPYLVSDMTVMLPIKFEIVEK